MWIFKVSNNFWLAWKEKFWTLFVSAKIILFFSCIILATMLLIYGYIDKSNWTQVTIASITVIAGFRGLMQIASVFGNRKGQIDESEFSGPTQHMMRGTGQELMGTMRQFNNISPLIPPPTTEVIRKEGFEDNNDV